jgi:hypothetical protein
MKDQEKKTFLASINQASTRYRHEDFVDGSTYAALADAYSKTQTPQENARRAANGRKSNVADTVAILNDVQIDDSLFFHSN